MMAVFKHKQTNKHSKQHTPGLQATEFNTGQNNTYKAPF